MNVRDFVEDLTLYNFNYLGKDIKFINIFVNEFEQCNYEGYLNTTNSGITKIDFINKYGNYQIIEERLINEYLEESEDEISLCVLKEDK